MKKTLTVILAVVIGIVFWSCKGEPGAAGAAGATGATGGIEYSATFKDSVSPSGSYDVPDTLLYEGSPSTNYGTSGSAYVGNISTGPTTCRMLVKFDISNSAIPANATVQSAKLRIRTTSAVDGTNTTITVKAVLEGWDEATATWNNKSTATPWTTAGGLLSTQTYSLSQPFLAPSNYYDIYLNTAMVASWITSTATNHGIAIISTNEAVNAANGICHSEANTIDYKPELVIKYSLP